MPRAPKTQSVAASETLLPASALLRLFDRRWCACRRELIRCRKEFSDRAVHGSRIQSRRLVSALNLIGVALPGVRVGRVLKLARSRLQSLSKVRDTHVQIGLTGRWQGKPPRARKFLKHLQQRERKLVREARHDLKHAELDVLERAALRLREEIENASASAGGKVPAGRLLQAVDRAFASVIWQLRSIQPGEPATIHRVRVAFKNFRYAAESAAGFVEGIGPDRLRAMRGFQRKMGRIQDTEIMLRRVGRFIAGHPREGRTMDGLRAALLAQQRRLIARFILTADGIQKLWPPKAHQPHPAAATEN